MNSNEKRIIRAVVECWASGQTPTQRRVAQMTKTKTQSALSQNSVARCFNRWEADSFIETQVGSNGIEGAAWRFNWFSAPGGSGLADVLSLALAPDVASVNQKRHLRTGARKVFRLAEQCADHVIIGAARSVGCDQLYGYPQRVMDAAIEWGNSSATAMNLRAAVRRAMERSAMKGVVQVVFPKAWEEEAWETAAWVYFPNNAPGLSASTVRTYRANWRAYGVAARQLFGEATGPSDMTLERVEELRRHVVRSHGKRYLRQQIRTILSYIGREHGKGPYADHHSDPDRTLGYNGRLLSGYLVGAKGEGASDANWKSVVRIFRHNGFDKRWRRFLLWYGAYSTLSDARLMSRSDRFPSRPPIRLLKQRTQVKRVVALRAFGYQLIRAAMEIDGLGPESITPEQAFGRYGAVVLHRLQGWWADRAERGEVSDASSAGLSDIIKSVGMVARTLYDKSRFERGIGGASVQLEPNRALEEEGAAKTSDEEHLWATYIRARHTLKVLEKARKDSPDGHLTTTLKNIKRMIENTPPAYWIEIQDELLKRVRAGEGANADSFAYHRKVLLTFLLGMMISTGFRIGETTHVRIGENKKGDPRQYGPGNRRERRMRLRAAERKNQRTQSGFLRERYCPAWLEELYLSKTRPFFMTRGSAVEHDWLLVDPEGRPYGCPEEREDGSGRDDIAHAERIAHLRDFWIDQLMSMAADLGKAIPLHWGEFAPHAIRNVFGYLLYQTRGKAAAANYLGDLEDSVVEVYAAVDGAHIDVSEAMTDGLSLVADEVNEVPAATATEGPSRLYTEEEFDAAVEERVMAKLRGALAATSGRAA